MYTKVFRSIFNGTLREDWRALITFENLLILADKDGVVDMTVSAIVGTTGIPQEYIEAGIAVLEAPDLASRSREADGRRIVRLEEDREWGWYIVNFAHYRDLGPHGDPEDKRKMLGRIRARRHYHRDKEVGNLTQKALGLTLALEPNVQQEQEQGQSAPTEPPAFRLPTNVTGKTFAVTKTFLEQMQRLYPGVDVSAEVRKMEAWLLCNPKNRKTHNGMTRFVNSWLGRAQDSARPGPQRGHVRSDVDTNYARTNLEGT